MRMLALLVFSTILPCALAQQSGNTAGTGSTTATQSSTSRTVVIFPTETQSAGQAQKNEELIFISGEVIMEDGTPPPFGAVIERECGGVVVKEAAVDPAGRFSYQIGDQNRLGRIFPDASQPIGQDPIDRVDPFVNPETQKAISDLITVPLTTKLVGCEMRAQLPGYRSTRVQWQGSPRSGIIDVGTIILYPVSRVQGATVSATNMRAPKNAKKALENARKAFKKNDFNESEKLLKSAIEIYPEYAQAWLDLGESFGKQGLNEEARNAYRRAIDIDKLFLGPYVKLAHLYANEGKWKESAETSDRALTLDPINLPEAYYLNALAYFNLNDLGAAEKSARRGLRMDLENRLPSLNIVLADVLEKKKDLEGSIAALKTYLNSWPGAPDADQIRSRIQEREHNAHAESGNARP